MIQKCMTYCNTDKYIKLRNNIFYFTMEIPRQNGKRRFICKSLHTYNYYEAREKAKIMAEKITNLDINKIINDFNTLWKQVVFDFDTVGGGTYGFAKRRISPRTDPMVLKLLSEMKDEIRLVKDQIHDMGQKIQFQQYEHHLPEMAEILKSVSDRISVLENKQNTQSKPTKDYTIREVLKSMLNTAGVSEPEKDRKFHIIKKNLAGIGMDVDTDYLDFYKPNVIQDLCDVIRKNAKINGDSKRKHVRYIKELITHANVLEPDVYKTNLLGKLPKFDKTPKSEKNPHFPYSDEQLLEMFDPKYDYFKKNPDQFWACMVALFTGSRLNAVITLQYGNIIQKDGIDCIQFIENHKLKKLKNEASQRIVPIPKQLLDMGFVQYFQNQKQKLKKTDSDFIFPKCQTKNGTFNGKVVGRGVLSFLTKIGIRGSDDKKLDFHSFRKNVSNKLQEKVGIQSFINNIVGWEGTNTMEKSYSNHTIPQIKEQADKLKYDFLQPHFDKWTEIMKKVKCSEKRRLGTGKSGNKRNK